MTKLSSLSTTQKREYLKFPNHCPFCGSDDIEAEPQKESSQKVSCHNCDRQWFDIYKLIDVEEVFSL